MNTYIIFNFPIIISICLDLTIGCGILLVLLTVLKLIRRNSGGPKKFG